MTGLRHAAQQALDVLDRVCNERRICIVLRDRAEDAIPANCPAVQHLWVAKHNLSEALAAPQPEPVVLMWQNGITGRITFLPPSHYLDTGAGWFCRGPVYLHPPKRQPLSDTDILQGWKSANKLMGVPIDQVVLTFGRWLEAMHNIGEEK